MASRGMEQDLPLNRLSTSSTESGCTDTIDQRHSEGQQWSHNQLPPMDGGAAAWKVLFGCWLLEAMIWGQYK
jgi:hypothetical protein